MFTNDVAARQGRLTLKFDGVTRLQGPPASIGVLLLDPDVLRGGCEIPDRIAELPAGRSFTTARDRLKTPHIRSHDTLIRADHPVVSRLIPHRSSRVPASLQSSREVDVALHAVAQLSDEDVPFGEEVPECYART